ncbi:MAG: OmpA family protein [bacterium]|nr:OmpA family protein [bacterium]
MRKRFGNGFNFIPILIFISSLLFLLLGLLPDNVNAKDAGLNQVLSIDAKSAKDSTDITIKTKSNPTYTDYRLEDPFRVMIDLSKANLKDVKKSISVNNAFVKDIKVTQLGEENDNLGRIEIVLTKKLKYQIQKDGNALHVSITHQEDTAPAPAAAPPAQSGDAVAEVPPLTESGAGIPPLESAPGSEAGGMAQPEISELPPLPSEGDQLALAEIPPLGEAGMPQEPVPMPGGEMAAPEAALPPPVAAAPPAPTAAPVTVPETIPEMMAPPMAPEIAALPPAPEAAPAPAPPAPAPAPVPAPEVAAAPPVPVVVPVAPEAAPAPAPAPPAPEAAPAPAAPAPEVAAAPPAPAPEPAPAPVPAPEVAAAPPVPVVVPVVPEAAPAPAPAPPAPEVAPAPAAPAPEVAAAPAPPAPKVAPSSAPAVVPPPPGGKRAIRKPLNVAAVPVNPPVQPEESVSPAGTKRLAWISGNKIELAEPIKFLLNEAVILPESLPVVNDVLKVMQENPGIKIRVEGHTDDEGPARYNQELSEYRSIWIKIFLMARGITADRVQVFGFGKSRPVASNTTPVGREKNRRVELRIIGR